MDVAARPWRRTGALILLTIVVAAATLLLARSVPPGRPPAFEFLFRRDEPAAAWLSCALIILAAAAARLFSSVRENALVAGLTADPRIFVAAVTAVLAGAAVLVYRAHPLAMDEYAPVFQAGAFARFSLTGKVPPELIPRMVPQAPFWFIQTLPSGEMISSYWPGLALLLTPFIWIGAPWLLNPLLGGATLLVLWRLARKLWPQTAAPGWAVLLTAASPAFVVNSISFYSMTAHLLAALGFAALMLEERYLAAGALGSLALVLHNPLPHAIYAVPWLMWVAMRPRRWIDLARLGLGYLPGTMVLGLGWFLFRARFAHSTSPGGAAGLHALVASLARVSFAAPSWQVLWDRSVSVCEEPTP